MCSRITSSVLLLSISFGLIGSSPAWCAARSTTILMLGDSILDCHEGEARIEVRLLRLLEKQKGKHHWTIFNEAHGGEYIGPREGTPGGVSDPLFSTEGSGRFFEILKRHPQADVIFVNYAANDGKVYPPSTFRKKLEFLSSQLKMKYPEAVLIFSTSMYLDPKHAAPYHQDNPQVPGFKDGSLRNSYLEPYNQEIRKFVKERHFGLADIYQEIARETAKGNWDLRLRAGEGDPAEDPRHQGDMAWYDNIHPNRQGTEVIARLYLRTLNQALKKNRE